MGSSGTSQPTPIGSGQNFRGNNYYVIVYSTNHRNHVQQHHFKSGVQNYKTMLRAKPAKNWFVPPLVTSVGILVANEVQKLSNLLGALLLNKSLLSLGLSYGRFSPLVPDKLRPWSCHHLNWCQCIGLLYSTHQLVLRRSCVNELPSRTSYTSLRYVLVHPLSSFC